MNETDATVDAINVGYWWSVALVLFIHIMVIIFLLLLGFCKYLWFWMWIGFVNFPEVTKMNSNLMQIHVQIDRTGISVEIDFQMTHQKGRICIDFISKSYLIPFWYWNCTVQISLFRRRAKSEWRKRKTQNQWQPVSSSILLQTAIWASNDAIMSSHTGFENGWMSKEFISLSTIVQWSVLGG